MSRSSSLLRCVIGSIRPRVPRKTGLSRISPVSRAWIHEVSAADLRFGQPVHETHPHVLEAGEITPGITAYEYAERRDALAAMLPEKSIAVIPSASLKYRTGPVFYPFSQNTDFAYLTGFLEPNALAIIDKRESEPVFRMWVQEKDEKIEMWEGFRSGTQAAMDVFNADVAHDINHVEHTIIDVLKGAEHIYTDAPASFKPRTKFERYFGSSNGSTRDYGFGEVLRAAEEDRSHGFLRTLKPLMSKLRVIKSDAEIANMRLAGRWSGRAITDAMRNSWKQENQLHSYLDYQFRVNGCEREAYVPVVAGGRNLRGIHYTMNNAKIGSDELILVDAGGEYGGYVTDITRTWPNSGKFSDAQRDLYTVVLNAQRTCVSLCREDANTTLDKIHKIAENGLKDGLSQLGFDISGNAMSILFPHHVGHYVGMDVHDCPEFGRSETLREGMCVTIEPGLYIPEDERWPKQFRGLGIRIEDSVCVEDEHPFVLTTEAVKEIVDIEALHNASPASP